MAISVPTTPVAARSKKTQVPKTKIPKAKASSAHPPYIKMIKAALQSFQDRKGTSKQAILKYISENFPLGENVIRINSHLRAALKKGVVTGTIAQASGTGANGRFRDVDKVNAKKKVGKKTTTAAAKPKKATATEEKKATDAGAKTKKAAAKPKKTASTEVKEVAAKPSKASAAKKASTAEEKAVKPKMKRVAKAPAEEAATKPATKKAAPKKTAD